VKSQDLASVFLGGIPVPKSRDVSRVLVLGGDRVGVELAERLASEGLQVVLLGEPGPTMQNRNVVHEPYTALEELRGYVGGFEAVLKTADGPLTERVGYVVAAGPARIVPKFAEYGLSEGERVLSLTDLEARLAAGATVHARQGNWAHVALLCGLVGEVEPALFRRIVQALEELATMDKVQTYVFCSNVKVAEAGLERRYRESRDRGTIYFKLDEAAVLEQSPEGVTMLFRDPLLGEEMELVPDLLVVDESLFPPASLSPLLATMPSAPAFAPFLGPESLRFPGVETPRAGFYAVGPSRGVYSPELIAADVETVVTRLTEAFAFQRESEKGEESPRTVHTSVAFVSGSSLPGPPHVDEARCVMCLTCVRLCPHGAMSFVLRAEADPESCVRCGICAAECPMQAITLAPRNEEEDLCRKVETELARGGAAKRIVGFLCSRSAVDAWNFCEPEVKRHVVPIPVPCAGSVAVSSIMRAFRQGAAAVLVAGCFKGNCASIYGSALAEQRAAETGRILETAGFFPGRVVFVPCASNNVGGLIWAVRDLEESLQLVEVKA
jgi:quinone-modifying oxidoreductase, subunit QmoB